ncbi:MAG: cytochrome b/b6 domain-containing protein [Steroidobacterales bacterium]
MANGRTIVIARHSLVTRLTHWINVVAMTGLLMSGLQILVAHPTLYWGESSSPPGTVWFHIGNHGGNMAFPGWLTLPSYRDLATGRRWHFFFAWLLVLNGLVYLIAALITRHLWRDLIPSRAELAPRHLATELWYHLKLQFPRGEATRHYNSLQKIAYAALVLVLAPLVILTGLTMSPGFDAIMPGLTVLFGGRQSARSLHFIAVNLILLFVVAHLGALLAVGVWNELRSMLTGRFRIRTDG